MAVSPQSAPAVLEVKVAGGLAEGQLAVVVQGDTRAVAGAAGTIRMPRILQLLVPAVEVEVAGLSIQVLSLFV